MRSTCLSALLGLCMAAQAIAGERQIVSQTDDGVRFITHWPADFDAEKPSVLLIYACPNGNSAEMTLGCKIEPGMDWHFDIQHIAAQVRKLRQLNRDENLVLAVVEAEKKSWPAWRKARPDNGSRIRHLVSSIATHAELKSPRVVLSGHSGGGSFIFGYVNGGETIDDHIDRIILIDANYAYDDAEKHGEKLLAWLKGDPARHLVVIAYDDRNITLGGKKVVSDTGGTFRASQRMMDRFKSEIELSARTFGEFDERTAMNGQVHFLVHGNPENRILHTVLVERNGLIEAMTLGTPMERNWGGTFWGDRAYRELIAPATQPITTAPARTGRVSSRPGDFPPRPDQAPGGRAFAEQIADLPAQAREAAIYQEIARGNVPDFLRKSVSITVTFQSPDGKRHEAIYQVMPDYLAVGSDADFFRVPMTPQTATRLADDFGYALPTRKIVNDVYSDAAVKLEPRPLTDKREAVETFAQHNAIIEKQRAGKPLGELVAGTKKDVVISNRLKEKRGKVAIYGWHKSVGTPIQPLYVGHVDWYVDYSHGIRLVKRAMTIDGKTMDVADVLTHPELCHAISDEGVIDARYP